MADDLPDAQQSQPGLGTGQQPDGQELTDEQLDGVAGGTNPAAGSLKNIDSGVKTAVDL